VRRRCFAASDEQCALFSTGEIRWLPCSVDDQGGAPAQHSVPVGGRRGEGGGEGRRGEGGVVGGRGGRGPGEGRGEGGGRGG